MAMTRKLSDVELKEITGGGEAECMAYVNELAAKYGIASTGIAEDDIEAVMKVCTDEEWNKIIRLAVDE